ISLRLLILTGPEISGLRVLTWRLLQMKNLRTTASKQVGHLHEPSGLLGSNAGIRHRFIGARVLITFRYFGRAVTTFEVTWKIGRALTRAHRRNRLQGRLPPSGDMR